MLLSREQLISCSNTQMELIKNFKSELEYLEKGKLIGRYRNTRIELYHVTKENSRRIEKRIYDKGTKETNIPNQLRRRWCIEKSILILERNVDSIKKVLKKYKNYDPFYINESMPKSYKSNNWIFDGLPAKSSKKTSLVYDIKLVNETEKISRERILYRGQTNIELKPEGLKFDTGLGFKVRSKSEVLISMILHKYNLIFKYEMPFYINGNLYYPDFLILDKNGVLIIWEHFGMMDNQGYQQSASKKIANYLAEDLVIGKNLIITSETSKNPIDLSVVEEFVAKLAEGI